MPSILPASLLLLASHAMGYMTHEVSVGGTNLVYNPPYVDAAPGDVIRFTFHEKNHTVTQSSFNEPCRPLLGSFGEPIGFDTGFNQFVNPGQTTNLPTFEVKVNDTNPIWVYCKQKSPPPGKTHCQQGMVFAANAAKTGPKTFQEFQKLAMDSTAQNQPTWSVTVANPASTPPPSNGGYNPPSNNGGQYNPPPSNNNGQYNPPSNNNDGQYKPPSNNGGQYNPPSNNNDGQYKPPSNNGGQYQPPSNNNGQYNPPSGNNGQYQPPPPPSNGGQYNPPSNNGGQYQPPSNNGGGYKPSQGQPKVYTVKVGGTFPNGTAKLQYDPEYLSGVNPGDVVEFIFGVNNHTATVSSFAEPCAHDPIQFDSGFNPVTNTTAFARISALTVADSNPIWMYCRQKGAGPKTHCQQGMVFAINPTATGKTFDEFKANALKSTAQNTNAPATPPTSGSNKLFGAVEDGSSTSSDSSNFGKYAPIVLGLLGAVAFLVIILLGLVVTLLVRGGSRERNRRVSSPKFRPLGMSGKDREVHEEMESLEYQTPSGRYTDEH